MKDNKWSIVIISLMLLITVLYFVDQSLEKQSDSSLPPPRKVITYKDYLRDVKIPQLYEKIAQHKKEMLRFAKLKQKYPDSLFLINLEVVPGELRRDQFSPSTRARRSDRAKITGILSRRLSAKEKLKVVLTCNSKDAKNEQINLIQETFRISDLEIDLFIFPKTNTLRKFIRGTYNLQIWRINTQSNNKVLWANTQFELR
ncbi:hypothetical protein BKI52_24175 [marine bacterium AO1-C]|nr:hypothetical protein BKI52_24175 [marine bacterium AO1-C]